MGRKENKEIFEDSRRRWETDPALREAVERSVEGTVLLRESDDLTCHEGALLFEERLRVVVSKKRSFEAARGYRGKKTCVLNFASATNPGGGVVNGASAQEECLCRISTLYPCLDTDALRKGFYLPHREAGDPLHNDDCIYTPDVVVFRADTESAELLPEDGRWKTDVLTCAAPNLRERPSNPMNPGDGQRRAAVSDVRLRVLIEKRIRRILDLAAEKGAQALVLGAFGCGAFRNPPEFVAAAMRDALEDYRYCFETAELAVYCPPGREENYRAFVNAFAGWD